MSVIAASSSDREGSALSVSRQTGDSMSTTTEEQQTEHRFSLTALQAREVAHRLALNEESQDEVYEEDRLPIWGRVDGSRLIVWSAGDCLDDLDSMIEIHDDNSGDPWEGPRARAASRSIRSLREKVRAAIGRTNSLPEGDVIVARLRGAR